MLIYGNFRFQLGEVFESRPRLSRLPKLPDHDDPIRTHDCNAPDTPAEKRILALTERSWQVCGKDAELASRLLLHTTTQPTDAKQAWLWQEMRKTK